MLVFNTEMHVITLVFVVLESIMFFFQLLYYLLRPQDKPRLWYLILLSLFIIYNVTGGLFPDPNFDISVITQNIIAYGSGFAVACYFPYYFYKGFGLTRLRFHALYGVPLFLILPYLIFFVVGYSISGNLDSAIKYGVVIPFFYSFVVLWAIAKAVLAKYKGQRNQKTFVEVVAVYCSVLPWVSMTVFSYYHVGQFTEVIVTNGGFIVTTILFISRYVAGARSEYEEFQELSLRLSQSDVFATNCKLYQLTGRETEIALLLKEGFKYKEIGEKLYISERTVATHVQNICEKTQVSGRVKLIRKLEQVPPELYEISPQNVIRAQ
ncbi:MAG: Regulatory protein luxR family [Sphingobacteriales bacterium]|nr:Regulatory protein luxR family [Sphingobacteriales bacterium]